MKKIVLLLGIFCIVTFMGMNSKLYSQQSLRIGELTLKDTLNGNLILKDGALNADLYTYGIYTNFLRVNEGFFVGESAICSMAGFWDFLNSVTFNSEVYIDDNLAISGNIGINGNMEPQGMIKSDTGWYEWHHNVFKIRDGNIFTIEESDDLYGVDIGAGVREGTIFYFYFNGSGNVISEGSSGYVDFLLPGGSIAYSPGDIIGFIYIDGYARQISISDF